MFRRPRRRAVHDCDEIADVVVAALTNGPRRQDLRPHRADSHLWRGQRELARATGRPLRDVPVSFEDLRGAHSRTASRPRRSHSSSACSRASRWPHTRRSATTSARPRSSAAIFASCCRTPCVGSAHGHQHIVDRGRKRRSRAGRTRLGLAPAPPTSAARALIRRRRYPTAGLARAPDGTHGVVADRACSRSSRAGAVSLVATRKSQVMYSAAAEWRDGREVWAVIHASEQAADHLVERGDLPPNAHAVKHEWTSKQASGVDHVYEVPLEVARLVVGYRMESEDDDDLELVALVATSPRPWWKLGDHVDPVALVQIEEAMAVDTLASRSTTMTEDVLRLRPPRRDRTGRFFGSIDSLHEALVISWPSSSARGIASTTGTVQPAANAVTFALPASSSPCSRLVEFRVSRAHRPGHAPPGTPPSRASCCEECELVREARLHVSEHALDGARSRAPPRRRRERADDAHDAQRPRRSSSLRSSHACPSQLSRPPPTPPARDHRTRHRLRARHGRPREVLHGFVGLGAPRLRLVEIAEQRVTERDVMRVVGSIPRRPSPRRSE